MDFEQSFMQGLADGIEKNAKFRLPFGKKPAPKGGAVSAMMEKVKGAAGKAGAKAKAAAGKAKEVAKEKGPAAAAGAAGGGILGALLARRGKKKEEK